ncbi:hypothetical protein BT63DRAFT_209693 [Microthyrium microscopicum]|uniref:Uncharacterized protein n=1 Tax=Microthyrium microscopicum TaxID=703497 RepID=A0A6A6UI92_9PEZI|nr:hypothetical protein BT63DRAFT_209693 [Microthyrium microscopicum]
MSTSDIVTLKHQLTITPKTATLLIKAGYTDYRDLAHVSPEQVAKQFADSLKVPIKHALAYKRPLRRIVWLGTQKHPENHPKDCKNWSNKALMARGVWSSDFDRLTGNEIDVKLKDAESIGIKKETKQKMSMEAKEVNHED